MRTARTRKHDSRTKAAVATKTARRKALAHRFTCTVMAVVLALGMTPGLAFANQGNAGGDGAATESNLVAGGVQMEMLAQEGNEPEGDEHDYAGTKFTWTDETLKVEYTCYVTSPKNQDATAALYSIGYVGDDINRYAEPETLEYGELDVVIPSTINGYAIAELGSTDYGTYDTLMYDLEVGSITVPATVTKVNRFRLDFYLHEIIFDPACQVTEIPDYFCGSHNTYGKLERVVLPNSVERIGRFAFCRNVSLASVNMPESLKTIDECAFAMTGLTALSFPEGLQAIARGAFASYSFYHDGRGTLKATSLTIPDSVESIGDYAFAFVTDQRMSGGEYTFSGTTTSLIESITFGSGLKHIGDYAFAESQVASLTLPASLEDIGDYAFTTSEKLETVTCSDIDAAQLTTIGEGAFSWCEKLRSFEMPASVTAIGDSAFLYCLALRDIALPPGLITLGESAFSRCEALETVIIPGSLEDFGKAAFSYCISLDDLTLSEGLETIGRFAFEGCTSLKSVTIPRSVSLIDQHAFGDWQASYNNQSLESLDGAGIEELTILGGNVPLSIGACAFAACTGLNGKTVTLPKRVTKLGGGAFVFVQDATFEIKNPNIEVYDKVAWSAVDIVDPRYYHLGTTTKDLSFASLYSNDPGEPDDEGDYYVEIPDPWASDSYFSVQKFLPSPNGSMVRYPNTLTSQTSPTFWGYLQAAEGGGGIRPTFEAVEMPPDEEIDDPVVEVAGAGRLEVVTNGSAGITANVCVFDAEGNLAASAQAQSRYSLITDLEPGSYTVVAFERNGYFSTVGSLDGFADSGVDASQYVQASAAIRANEDTQLELTVPKMSATSTNLVQSSSVAISKQQTYKNQEFFATVNFRMESGKTATALKVKLPSGLSPTSVSSAKKNYGISGYNATTRTLTVALDSVDAQTGRIYVGLTANETGRHVVSASVVSGGTTVPIGDAATTVSALSLDLPTAPVQGKAFVAGVHAAPNTAVTLQVAGITQTVTTNRVGNAQASIDLSDVETTLSYTIVLASVDDNGETVTQTGMVEFETTQTSVATLQDFTFVHAGEQYYIVRKGRTQPPSKYYVYIANGKETNKYWTFTATYVSEKPLKFGGDASAVIQSTYCTVRVQMLDGSSRYQDLQIIKSEKQDDGTYLNTFAGTLYLEQAGDHVFPTSLVPRAFDVTLHLPDGEEAERTQADIDALRDMHNVSFGQWAEKAMMRTRDVLAREDVSTVKYPGDTPNPATWEDDGWDEYEGYSWIFFYDIYEQPIWEYYKQALGEDSPDYVQLRDYVNQMNEAIDVAGSIFDAIYGINSEAEPEKSITSCSGAGEFFEGVFDYEPNFAFDPTALEAAGFKVTNDTNAPSAGTGGGTPTNGLTGGQYAEPASYATKVERNSDGGVKSVQYRDSNGNSATIPVDKMNNGIDWLLPNKTDILNNLPTDNINSFFDGIDDQINRNMTAADKAKYGESKLGKGSRALGNGLKVALAAKSQYDKIKQSEELANYYSDAAEARGEVGNIEVHLNYLRMHNMTGTPCYKAWLNERDWAIIVAEGKAANRDWNLTELIRGECLDIFGATTGPITGGTGAAAAYGVDKITGKAVADGMDSNKRVLNSALQNLNAAHAKRVEDCGEDKPKDAPNSVPPILDPSGIVYEAFPANLLEGVTATVYEVTGGVPAETPWAAGDYDQENPQVTGSEGFFGWDVPQGNWQVKFSRDGYEPTQTSTLQVPPPQVGLEVPMVSTAAPEVVNATADTRTLEIAFNQYMKADASALSGVSVQVDGTTVATSNLSWKDVEDATTGQFSKVLVAIVPGGTKAGDSLNVSVSGVKNYADKPLASPYTTSVTVAARPAKLVFNFEDTISLQVGTSRPTSVRVYDADNQPMQGVHLTASLDNNMFATVNDADAVTDEEGVAKLQLEALMPGMSELTVQAEGTALSSKVKLLTTADANKAARPTIRFVDEETGKTIKTIGEGAPNENTVYINKRAKMYIESATEDATIFYTLDGSCPCQNTSGRVTLYGDALNVDGVSIADYIFAAYKDGMDYSDRLKVNIRLEQDPVEIKDIAGATVTGLSKQAYTGAEIKPVPTVMLDGKTLTNGTDFTLTYARNVNVGTATATITGTGDYTGTIEKTFEISAASLSAASVTLSPASCTYTGGELKPAVTVKLGSKTLANGTDYTVAYSANTAVGTAKATVKGTGNYTGAIEKTFAIGAASLSAASVTLSPASCTYTGGELKPAVTVKLGSKTLVSGTDYTVAYSANTAVGTAKATITGKGNYTGTIEKSFEISVASLGAASVTLSPASCTYTGGELKPAVTVKLGSKTLVNGADYTVAYKNNVNVGTAVVAITGKGNYKDSVNKNYAIAAVSMSKVTISGVANKTYTGTAQAQALKLAYAGKTLKVGKDYVLQYYNAGKKAIAASAVKAAGTYYVAVKGKGGYTGISALKQFKVSPRAISAAAMSGVANKTYTGKALGQAPKLVYNKVALKMGTDYTLQYYNSKKKAVKASSVKKAGTYYVAAKGKGNYSGTSALKAFKVLRASLAKASVASVKKQVYDGKVKKPSPAVKLGKKKLKKGTDYTLQFYNSKKKAIKASKVKAVGTYYVAAKGKGSYKGKSPLKKFKIVRR